jgi:hypothetical protein
MLWKRIRICSEQEFFAARFAAVFIHSVSRRNNLNNRHFSLKNRQIWRALLNFTS